MKYLITAVVVFYAIQSHAQPFHSRFNFKGLNQEEYTKEIVGLNANCADFSGQWEGQCTPLMGVPWKATMKVAQHECRSIQIDNETFFIGGAKIETLSGPSSKSPTLSYLFNLSILTAWSPSFDKITFHGTVTIATMGTETKNKNESFLSEFYMSGKMLNETRISNSKLEVQCQYNRI